MIYVHNAVSRHCIPAREKYYYCLRGTTFRSSLSRKYKKIVHTQNLSVALFFKQFQRKLFGLVSVRLSVEAGRDFALLKGSPESCKIYKDFSWLVETPLFTLWTLQGVFKLSQLFPLSNFRDLKPSGSSERIEEHEKFGGWDRGWCHGVNILAPRPAY